MPWWLHIAIEMLCLVIVCAAVIITLVETQVWIIRALARRAGRYQPRHKTPEPGPRDPDFPGGPGFGAMTLEDERAYRARLIPRGEWNDSITEANGGWDHRQAFWNGHTFGCVAPDEEHLGACPEEGDWPDEHGWPVPDLPPDIDLADPAAGVDLVLASETEDPAATGWTDQLLAELHDAPTVLDILELTTACRTGRHSACGGWHCPCVCHERQADTGEIALASLRADYAAELSAQDYDAAEFISRQASEAAEFRLHVNGL